MFFTAILPKASIYRVPLHFLVPEEIRSKLRSYTNPDLSKNAYTKRIPKYIIHLKKTSSRVYRSISISSQPWHSQYKCYFLRTVRQLKPYSKEKCHESKLRDGASTKSAKSECKQLVSSQRIRASQQPRELRSHRASNLEVQTNRRFHECSRPHRRIGDKGTADRRSRARERSRAAKAVADRPRYALLSRAESVIRRPLESNAGGGRNRSS